MARPPDSITLLEVVNAVEPIRRIQECPLGLRTHSGRLCALHAKLDTIAAMTERALRETTLTDVVRVSDGVSPLCDADDDGLVQLG